MFAERLFSVEAVDEVPELRPMGPKTTLRGIPYNGCA
jgi:hypothetical protein